MSLIPLLLPISMVWIILFILLIFLFPAFTAYIAEARGYGYWGWFAIGFFFGPLGFFAIGFMPDKRQAKREKKIIECLEMLLKAEYHKKKERESAENFDLG